MNSYPISLHRYDSSVKAYLEKPVIKNGILLYGSSFFCNWKNAADEVFEASNGKYTVVNHGFGGATVDELLLAAMRASVIFSVPTVCICALKYIVNLQPIL